MGSSFGGYHNPELIPAANPMDQTAKALAIKGQLQQQQMSDIQLQQAQQQQKDTETVKRAFMENKGDLDATIKTAAERGVSPQMLTQLQQHALDVKTKVADLVTKQGAIAQQQADLMQGAHDAVDKAPAEQKPAIYQQQLQALHRQNIDVSQMPQQYPGDEQFKFIGATVQGHAKQVAQAFEERKVSAEEMAAQARKTAADAAVGKSGPLAPPVIPQLNQGLAARWNVLNPGQPPPEWAQIQPGAKKEDFDRADKLLQQVEQAQGVKAQQETANAARAAAQAQAAAAKGTARGDKSYQFNSGQLEKVAAPVDQAISRMGRLQDALAQNTPQADALIAPELLSVMAGGAGSGLRMNEAEIGRIVGGRSKWETLKASINQWSLDPSKANSITPEQRKEIRALVSEVDTKLKTKQAALEDARQGLLNTDDPGQHRAIVAKARSKMTEVDQGENGGTGSGMVRFKDSQGGIHDIPAANLDKAKQRDPGLQVIQQ